MSILCLFGHKWDKCKCSRCNERRKHDWDNSICRRCSAIKCKACEGTGYQSEDYYMDAPGTNAQWTETRTFECYTCKGSGGISPDVSVSGKSA